MTNRGINLLVRKQLDTNQNAVLEKYKKGLVSAAVFYICLVGIVFTAYLILVFQENKVKGDIAKAETTIKSFKKTETVQTALKNRVNTINVLLKGQNDSSSSLGKIQKLFPEGTVINKISFVSDGMNFEISVPTFEQLSVVFQSVKENKADFEQLIVGPVTREPSGSYTITFDGKLAAK
ncbi:hypothetical protein COT44_02205 [Candidatus Shapirobacteria bacterium CG08_land_8_20_14_0_20_39_18]|uniref:Uncharacterized protein n=1 Tax=Candidatus Shapirobacteria bacterium CG08_land_8_20_14_0_20_39_18 TaxID=1974883 RepID=A0A2M6XD28_9BACT|nr:MAG: hypothetical protein COT44_02205 [Candidatus Shapirobacteria bacterium CG08_land_8_20_14_0_20_39_18]PIY66124.1 MAG: hypothetical protein COY91_01475 [Candidatus Shapirobacteria bacterium CG_4_10_14_0_8_um_filter_39_15]PJE68511.1 MAG: hypothetical protein COU94_01445 [Candidatus Shapirobacteria bacterium CG10_big_fil_rev_8_21_14_0_10_38_8]